MRLPDGLWHNVGAFGLGADLARLTMVAPVLRDVVETAVAKALVRRYGLQPPFPPQGPVPLTLRVVELRAGSRSKIAETKEAFFVSKSDGSIVTYAKLDGSRLRVSNSLVVAAGERVLQVTASSHSVCALTNAGHVWSWGLNENGQLGHGDLENRGRPTRIEALSEVVHVACGYDFVLAATNVGVAYYWGNTSDLPSHENEEFDDVRNERYTRTPTRADAGNRRVVSACAGFTASLLLCDDGRLLGCGDNRQGELGFPQDEVATAFRPIGGRVLANEYVVKASTTMLGYSKHTLVLTASGKLYGFGSNDSGQLGSCVRSVGREGGGTTDFVPPQLIEELTQVSDMSAAASRLSFAVTTGENHHVFGMPWGRGNFVDCSTTLEGTTCILARGFGGHKSVMITAASGDDSEIFYSWNPSGSLRAKLVHTIEGTGPPPSVDLAESQFIR